MSSECRTVCHKIKSADVSSLCQKDCLMSNMVELVSILSHINKAIVRVDFFYDNIAHLGESMQRVYNQTFVGIDVLIN